MQIIFHYGLRTVRDIKKHLPQVRHKFFFYIATNIAVSIRQRGIRPFDNKNSTDENDAILSLPVGYDVA